MIMPGEMVMFDHICKTKDEDREKYIRIFVDHILPAGMFSVNTDLTLSYLGGLDIWCKKFSELLHTKTAIINSGNVLDWTGPVYQLHKAIINPLETDVLFIIDFMSGMGTAERSGAFMQFINRLKQGEILNIGTIAEYHC